MRHAPERPKKTEMQFGKIPSTFDTVVDNLNGESGCCHGTMQLFWNSSEAPFSNCVFFRAISPKPPGHQEFHNWIVGFFCR